MLLHELQNGFEPGRAFLLSKHYGVPKVGWPEEFREKIKQFQEEGLASDLKVAAPIKIAPQQARNDPVDP